MKRLLLTGATGYLGQHIQNEYALAGWDVKTLGRSPSSDYVFDDSSIDSILEIEFGLKFDRIIHAAAINEVGIAKSVRATYEINVTLTRVLLAIAKKLLIPEFVFISTFHVYGRYQGRVDENTERKPLNDYGLTHYLAEVLVDNYREVHGTSTIIIRPTNIYGVPVDLGLFDRWTLVPFEFVRSAKKESKIVIKSSGLQKRNFVSVKDVVKATFLIGQESVVNAYGNDSISIRDFALMIKKIVGDRFGENVEVIWNKEDQPDSAELFIKNQSLGYQPSSELEQYIVDMYEAL